LYEHLPESVIVNGRKYRVDLDFRNVLRMLDTMDDQTLTPEARDWVALSCVMKKPKMEAFPAVKSLLFGDKSKDGGGEEKKRVTSFEQDADVIRAAFRQVYGINLYKDRLHWFEFTELLNALPEGNRYMEIIGIRARPMPPATKFNREEREWLAKAKQQVALHETEEQIERNYSRDVKNVFKTMMGMAQKG
jgi:hypothetical protein